MFGEHGDHAHVHVTMEEIRAFVLQDAFCASLHVVWNACILHIRLHHFFPKIVTEINLQTNSGLKFFLEQMKFPN